MPSTGTEKTFAWIGSAIVNVAFITFITWGATANWWIGFVVSILYTILLFALARLLDSEHGWWAFLFRSPNDVEDIDRFNESNLSQRPTMLVTLLYGLATLSLGVTGSFLSMNAIDCSTDPYDTRPRRPEYQTNLTKLPSDVQEWVRHGRQRYEGHSFVYLPGSNRTIFNEFNDYTFGKLWSVTSQNAPRILHKNSAYEFVLPTPSLSCFVTTKNQQANNYGYDDRKIVACSDGMTMQFPQNKSPIEPNYRRNLFVSHNHFVWYMDDPPSDLDTSKFSDRLVYSLDINTMIETLHSEHVNNTDDEKRLPYQTCQRTKALASLALVAVPTIVSSIYLWYKRHVPSMGITTFLGTTAAALSIFYSLYMETDPLDHFFQRWLLWFGLIYMVLCSNGIVSSYFEHKGPMQWGLHISALSFMVGSSFVLRLYDDTTVSFGEWSIFNLAVLVPLCMVGLATRSSFLLVLTAGGILMDAFRLCFDITKNEDNETVTALVYFGILGLTGLLTAFSGWLLSRRQDDLSTFLTTYLEPYAWPRRRTPEFEALPTQEVYHEAPPTTNDDEGNPSGSYSLEARSTTEE